MTSIPVARHSVALADAIASTGWLREAAGAVIRAGETTPTVEPLKGALIRGLPLLGVLAPSDELIAGWRSRTPGTVRSEARYRWELTHRIGAPIPAYAGPPSAWTAWRRGDQPRLEREPFEFEMGLLLPILSSENAELLLELASTDGEVAAGARELLAEAAPVLRRDFARHVQMPDPWEDTFALWNLTRQPRALSLLHPLAVAIAACYAANAEVPIRGARFPYHAQPLVSATAQFASALLSLGSDLDFAAGLSDFVQAARRPSGAWGDVDEPDDVLTSFVCADLLARIDPSFDPAATIQFYRRTQRSDGFWAALGPDAPWLTLQVLQWITSMAQPFSERFRWPHRAEAIRDHKTRLPFFAYFAELAQLFATLPGLANANIEIAFIDLIGFRAFNNQFGQSAGDDVLREFAGELDRIAGTRPIRDGGDEFLVVGAPTLTGLRDIMDTFRRAWPSRFRSIFGADVPPVAARVLVGRTRGRGLRSAREELGRGITGLKNDPAAHPSEGLLVDAGPL